MILLIDIGNTKIKCGAFDHDQIKTLSNYFYRDPFFKKELMADWKTIGKPEKILVSTVALSEINEAIRILSKELWNIEPIFIQENQINSSIKQITTKNKLGVDRWLSLLALHQTESDPFAIVGCGTAITIDICQNGIHKGGLITPGIELMRLALIEHTANCRLNPGEKDSSQLLAPNTDGAIRAGTLQMAISYIENTLEKIEKSLNLSLKKFITGGDSERLLAQFQKPDEFTFAPSLVLQGLALFADYSP